VLLGNRIIIGIEIEMDHGIEIRIKEKMKIII
jgi:hypothetical protein